MQREPTGHIRGIFSEVPRTYELVNHILTFGLDLLWRRRAVRVAVQGGGPVSADGSAWADLGTGTGEMAAHLRRLAPEGTVVYAVDLTPAMLEQARAKPGTQGTRFLISDVKRLPFADRSLDLITVSFATRNMNLSRDVLVQTFAEFRRVLRPGGRLVNVETSQPPCKLVRWGYHLHVKLLVKPIGRLVSGSRRGYAYLAHTIQRFYTADELAEILRQAGFSDVSYRRLFLGVAAIHQAVR
jgi:demethylmenaquinone methyltransferase/2-methoxy-6-polyprenyl-1,4-benzoquinol methylase